MLADGITNQYKVADITVDTPYYNGKLEAVCMKRPLYNLIIGNIPGAKYPCLEKQIEAVSADIIPVDIPDNSNKNPRPIIGAAITRAQAKSVTQKTHPYVEQS